MRAILLWLARFNEFGHDTQSHPPSRQCRQPRQCGSRKRNAVVGTNARWQSVLLEESGKDRLGAGDGRGVERLATQQVAAVAIGHGQRIAVAAVSGLELSFVIRTPEVVGRQYRAGGFTRMTDASALPLLGHH